MQIQDKILIDLYQAILPILVSYATNCAAALQTYLSEAEPENGVIIIP
jgi:hypothetical protein